MKRRDFLKSGLVAATSTLIGRHVAGIIRIKNNALGKEIMEQLSRKISADTGG
jgi:hypothetical protein